MALNDPSITGRRVYGETVWFDGRREPLFEKSIETDRSVRDWLAQDDLRFNLTKFLTGFFFGCSAHAAPLAIAVNGEPVAM